MSNVTAFCRRCELSYTNQSNITNQNFHGERGPFPILSQHELYAAVDDYLRNSSNTSDVALKYGYPIGLWNVSQIVNFSSTFDSGRNPLAEKFSEDLNGWDTSSAISMSRMFAGASFFNGNISSWSTVRVESMEAMFQNAYMFNGDITSWDTSSCTNMAFMFQGADLFNGNLSSFDTSKVVDMSAMFSSAISFEGVGLENWDTSEVMSMKALFSETFSFRTDVLSSWNVSSVIDMAEMFQFSSFNGNIVNWNVANVRDFQYAFSGAGSFNHNLSTWNVSQGINFNGMVRCLVYAM
jgi:surface protein